MMKQAIITSLLCACAVLCIALTGCQSARNSSPAPDGYSSRWFTGTWQAEPKSPLQDDFSYFPSLIIARWDDDHFTVTKPFPEGGSTQVVLRRGGRLLELRDSSTYMEYLPLHDGRLLMLEIHDGNIALSCQLFKKVEGK